MRRHDFRFALICAAAVTGAFFIVNPFVNMPFDDDWSYAYTVRQLLATGHITYNGWSAPLIITHALWGAMFVKLFGYSFVTLRFSTLPFVIGTAVFSYLLARRANLRPAAAICASLTLCLSPLFLPLAESFMTDVPAVCYTLVSLYALVRAAQATRSRLAIIWLVVGVFIGIIGGMNRQTVWIVPLCVVPYLIIIRRSDWRFVVSAMLGWLVLVLDMVICLRWFGRQPDIYLDPSPLVCMGEGIRYPGIFLTNTIMVIFTTIMFALPAALPFAIDFLRELWAERKTWRGAVKAVVVLGLSAGMAMHPAFGMAPWLYNIVTAKGVIGPLELSGSRPVVLPLFVRGIVSALVLMITYLLAAKLVELMVDFRKSLVRLRYFFAAADSRVVMTIFALAYFALMMIRAAHDQVFDRYCLPLIPCLAIPLLRGRSLRFAWPVLVIYAAYAIASTQDNSALAAARREAVERLESHGVPRTEIAAGLEYDFYTQLEEQGRINRYGMTNPREPFYDYEGYTPALKCRYRLEYPLGADMKASPFGRIEYISWLPPFHRAIYIDEFRNPWWLDSKRPINTVVPLNFEYDYEN